MIEIKRKVLASSITGGWPMRMREAGFYDVVLDYKSFVFSGGEVSVKLNNNYKFFDPTVTSDIEIRARINESLN